MELFLVKDAVKKTWDSVWGDIQGVARTYPFAFVAAILGMVFILFAFSYKDGESLTAWSVEVWDAIVDGPLIHDYSANVRHAPHGSMSARAILYFMPWAIWNFPIWLTHPLNGNPYVHSAVCMLWSKLGLVVCAFAVGLVCSRIVERFSVKKEQGWTAAILFWGSGTLAISVGIFAQDEIFYILALLCALNNTLEKRRFRSLVWMTVAVSIMPAMIVPCLLLIFYSFEKLIFKIISAMLICSPYVLNAVFVPVWTGVADPNDYLGWYFKQAQLSGGYSTFGVVVCILAALQFFNKYETEEERKQYLLYHITCLMIAMCVFTAYNAYRAFLYVPFLAISISIIPDSQKRIAGMAGICVFEYSLFMCMCLENYWFWPFDLSEAARRILGVLPYRNITMYSLLTKYIPFLSGKEYLVPSVMFAWGIWLLCLIYPRGKQKIKCGFSPRVIMGIYSVCAFLFTALFCLLLYKTDITKLPINDYDIVAPAMTGSNSLDEYYKAKNSASRASVAIRPVTWNRAYPEEEILKIEIIDAVTGEIAGKSETSASVLPDNQPYTFEFKDIRIQSGRWYIFRLSPQGIIENEENYLYILQSKSGTADPEKHYAVIRDSSGQETQTDYDWISQIILY